MSDDRYRPSPVFWLLVPLAGLLTWVVHEFAHFQAGRWLGYGMWVSLNQAGLLEGEYGSTAHRMIVAMSGPLVTYLQAGVALWLVLRWRAGAAYPFLFFAWFTRTLAFAAGVAHPNDEARTSLDLGLPVWVLPAIVCSALLVALVVASRRLRIGWKTHLGVYLIASAVCAAIVLGDPVVGRLVEAGPGW